jgi:predicted nuclease of predicted toxin-antitoxin system
VRRFLVDNQLPAALTAWLQSKGCEASHVLSLQLAQSRDEVIWAHAATEGSIIVSKDEDFARLTLLRVEPVAVVWLRLGNCRTASLLATMEGAWDDIISQLDAGARLVEVQ